MNITLFENVHKAYTSPEAMLDLPWDAIAELLLEFQQSPEKEKCMMFNLWVFDPEGEQGRYYHDNGVFLGERGRYDYIPGTVRRCSANAMGVSGLVLDYDHAKTMHEACVELDGLEFVMYTTYNHTPDNERFRVVLPFTRLMSKDEFRSKQADIKKIFPHVDNASFSESQAIYLHCGPTSEHAIAFRATGSMIDPDMFEVEIQKPVAVEQRTFVANKEMTAEQQIAYKDAVLKALLTCKELRRGAAKGTGGPLLVAICKAAGISFGEFEQICERCSAADSTLRIPAERVAVWRTTGQDNQRITKEVRDNFIRGHNGTVPNFSLMKPEPKYLTTKLFSSGNAARMF